MPVALVFAALLMMSVCADGAGAQETGRESAQVPDTTGDEAGRAAATGDAARATRDTATTTGGAAAGGAAAGGAAADADSRRVYRSNALAMELEVLPSGRVPAEGFALVVERTTAPNERPGTTDGPTAADTADTERPDGRVTATIVERRLYRDGEAIERVVVERDGAGRVVRERQFEEGTLRREEEFLVTGLVEVTREYDESGALEREIRYEYVDRALVRREVLGIGQPAPGQPAPSEEPAELENGQANAEPAAPEQPAPSDAPEEPAAPDQLETLYVDTLSYYPSGGIRELVREWADGRRRTVRYSVVNGDVLQERFETDGDGRLVRYDERQRAVYEREWRGSTVIREARHSYQAGSQTPTRSEEVLPPENRRIVQNFDDQGRLLRERVYENERLVRDEENSYGPEGRTETVVTTRGVVERRTFTYEDDRLVEERVYRNGTLTRSITYTDERSRVERRYRDGEVFARIYYRDDAAVREEILRNGRVVESRELR